MNIIIIRTPDHHHKRIEEHRSIDLMQTTKTQNKAKHEKNKIKKKFTESKVDEEESKRKGETPSNMQAVTPPLQYVLCAYKSKNQRKEKCELVSNNDIEI